MSAERVDEVAGVDKPLDAVLSLTIPTTQPFQHQEEVRCSNEEA